MLDAMGARPGAFRSTSKRSVPGSYSGWAIIRDLGAGVFATMNFGADCRPPESGRSWLPDRSAKALEAYTPL